MNAILPARCSITRSPQPSRRPTLESGAIENASIFIDTFNDSEAHGFKVEAASAEVGPNGDTYRYCQRQAGGGTLPHLTALKSLVHDFSSKPLAEGEANELLDHFITSAATGYLDLIGGVLDEVTSEGFSHSVANASQGFDELTLFQLLGHPLRTKSPSSETYKQNLELCLEQQRQVEVIPQFSDPRMTRDQLLLRRIGKTLRNSPEVKAASERWSARVREFESGHNSVVVAAGNTGHHLNQLSRIGFVFDQQEDFNLLAVPEVTTVGASKHTPEGEMLASSSSFGPEVDLLAEGSFGGTFGTSFSAPKVANAMRAVHQRFPEKTSSEVELFVRGELCSVGQPIAMLDLETVQGFQHGE